MAIYDESWFIYAAAGGGGGLLLLIVIGVCCCMARRRRRERQRRGNRNSQEMAWDDKMGAAPSTAPASAARRPDGGRPRPSTGQLGESGSVAQLHTKMQSLNASPIMGESQRQNPLYRSTRSRHSAQAVDGAEPADPVESSDSGAGSAPPPPSIPSLGGSRGSSKLLQTRNSSRSSITKVLNKKRGSIIITAAGDVDDDDDVVHFYEGDGDVLTALQELEDSKRSLARSKKVSAISVTSLVADDLEYLLPMNSTEGVRQPSVNVRSQGAAISADELQRWLALAELTAQPHLGLQDVQVNEEIFRGVMGPVYRGKLRQADGEWRDVHIRQPFESSGRPGRHALLREASVALQVSHPSMLVVRALLATPHVVWSITDPIFPVQLNRYLKEAGAALSDRQRLDFARQVEIIINK